MLRRSVTRWIFGAVLVFSTALSWHHRFEFAPHPVNAQTLGALVKDDPVNAQHRGLSVIGSSKEGLVRIEKKKGVQKHCSLSLPFPDSIDCQAVLIRFDYRYENVVRGKYKYSQARGIISDQKDDRWFHPADSLLFVGEGSKPWTHIEVIRELPETGCVSRLQFEMLGSSGLLEIKNFEIFKVREHPWFLYAVLAISLLWIWWIFSIVTNYSKPSRSRKTLATMMIFGISWVTIFPQANTIFFPLVGEFKIDGLITSSSPQHPISEAFSPTLKAPTREIAIPQARDRSPQTAPAPLILESEKPEQASLEKPTQKEVAQNKIAEAKNNFNNTLRTLAHQRRWLHLPAYLIFTLLFLTVTGRNRSILVVIILALLAEIIPPTLRYGFDASDLVDLAFNLCGILFGYLCWKRLPHLRNNGKKVTLGLPT